jgi:DNA excision repair protein ERCC-3
MIGVEHLEEDSDGKALLKARRSAGSMSAFSGAGGRVYLEYRCCIYPTLLLFFYLVPYPTSSLYALPVSCSSSTKGKGAPKKPKDPSKRHQLFKKRYA